MKKSILFFLFCLVPVAGYGMKPSQDEAESPLEYLFQEDYSEDVQKEIFNFLPVNDIVRCSRTNKQFYKMANDTLDCYRINIVATEEMVNEENCENFCKWLKKRDKTTKKDLCITCLPTKIKIVHASRVHLLPSIPPECFLKTLSKLKNIVVLDLSDTFNFGYTGVIKEISLCDEASEKIQVLWLKNCLKLRNICSLLENLKNIKGLKLDKTKVKEIRFSDEANKTIRVLSLSWCRKIKDFSFLQKLKRVRVLNLCMTKVEEIRFSDEANKTIRVLDLNNCNKIENFSFLPKLKNLKLVDLSDTNAPNDLIKELREKGVNVIA